MINKQTTLELNGPILSFVQTPVSVTVDNAGSATFVGVATATFPTQSPPNPASNSGSISYQWHATGVGPLSDGQFRGATLTGTATTTLTISGAVSPTTNTSSFFLTANYTASAYSQPTGSPVTAGTARSTGRDINYGITSNAATLTVKPFITVTTQPQNATTATGGQAIFTVDATLSDTSYGTLFYQWQLDGQNLSDSTSPLISGSTGKTLIFSPSSTGTYSVRVIITNANAQQVTSNIVTLTVVSPRSIIVFEGYSSLNDFQKVETNLDSGANYTLTDSTFRSNTSIITFYAAEKDIDTEIEISAAKGSNNGSYTGGNGGNSRIRLTLKKNEEYTILGIPNNSGVFLYRGSSLIASVGKGGDAGSTGNGGAGGGVSNAGENGSGTGAGIGGSKVTDGQLTTTGIFGSNSSVTSLLTGDTKADVPNGGRAISCTKGSYWIQQGISACSNNGTVQFRNVDGTLINLSALITRGFKPGYTVNETEGKAIGSGGNGGGGATGGAGGNSSGGGGGSGYTDGSVSVLASTVGGNTATKSTINFKVYVAPTPAPTPSPSPGGGGGPSPVKTNTYYVLGTLQSQNVTFTVTQVSQSFNGIEIDSVGYLPENIGSKTVNLSPGRYFCYLRDSTKAVRPAPDGKSVQGDDGGNSWDDIIVYANVGSFTNKKLEYYIYRYGNQSGANRFGVNISSCPTSTPSRRCAWYKAKTIPDYYLSTGPQSSVYYPNYTQTAGPISFVQYWFIQYLNRPCEQAKIEYWSGRYSAVGESGLKSEILNSAERKYILKPGAPFDTTDVATWFRYNTTFPVSDCGDSFTSLPLFTVCSASTQQFVLNGPYSY